MLRYLSLPATVLDVGGASGAYALWLAERGYQVHLIDPMPRLVEAARRRSEASPNRIWTCRVGARGTDVQQWRRGRGVALRTAVSPHRRGRTVACAPGGIPGAPTRWPVVCRSDFALCLSARWRCTGSVRRPLFRGDCAARPGAGTTPKRDGQLGLLHHCVFPSSGRAAGRSSVGGLQL